MLSVPPSSTPGKTNIVTLSCQSQNPQCAEILDLPHEQRLVFVQKNPKILSMCPFREENEVKELKEKPREKDIGALAEAKETAVDKTGNISESSEDKVDDLKVEELKEEKVEELK